LFILRNLSRQWHCYRLPRLNRVGIYSEGSIGMFGVLVQF
jgi:hypothetical protein